MTSLWLYPFTTLKTTHSLDQLYLMSRKFIFSTGKLLDLGFTLTANIVEHLVMLHFHNTTLFRCFPS